MCGTEQSKEMMEEMFDDLWAGFVRDEKFDHDTMAHIHPDGKCLKEHTEKQPFDLSSIVKGTFAKNFGVKKETDNMENDKATYVPAIFKGFIKNLDTKEVISF